jgi:hypothetical protein
MDSDLQLSGIRLASHSILGIWFKYLKAWVSHGHRLRLLMDSVSGPIGLQRALPQCPDDRPEANRGALCAGLPRALRGSKGRLFYPTPPGWPYPFFQTPVEVFWALTGRRIPSGAFVIHNDGLISDVFVIHFELVRQIRNGPG